MEERKAPPQIPKDALKFPSATPEHPHTFKWLLVALVFVLAAILIALVAWLFLLQDEPAPAPTPLTERPSAEANNEPESTTAEVAAETQQTMSPSTNIESIETDINSTQTIDLEPLFADIEAMFD
jgi:cytoskeletal protein RodZ